MEFELNEEQRALKEVVHDFVAQELRPRARHTDETGEFNWTAARKMGPLGLLGLEVPEEYGGAALDAISVAIVIEELGWGCGSTRVGRLAMLRPDKTGAAAFGGPAAMDAVIVA